LNVDLPSISLVIVGKGDYELKLRQEVIKFGLTDKVQFTGFVSEEDKIILLKKSSVFVCCSIDEGGWTIAGLEAMKCGVPLVVTDSQKDLVKEGITGFVTSYEVVSVAEKIRAVLNSNWKSMSDESYKMSSNITWENSAKVALRGLNLAMDKYRPHVWKRHSRNSQ
jgi:glycosyltransferase involved in cell wall biosynthesis